MAGFSLSIPLPSYPSPRTLTLSSHHNINKDTTIMPTIVRAPEDTDNADAQSGAQMDMDTSQPQSPIAASGRPKHSPLKTPTGHLRQSKKTKPANAVAAGASAVDTDANAPPKVQRDGTIFGDIDISDIGEDIVSPLYLNKTVGTVQLADFSELQEILFDDIPSSNPPSNFVTAAVTTVPRVQDVSLANIPDNIKHKYTSYILTGVKPILHGGSEAVGFVKPLTTAEHRAVYDRKTGLLTSRCKLHITSHDYTKDYQDPDKKSSGAPVERIIDLLCGARKHGCPCRYIVCRIANAMLLYEYTVNGTHPCEHSNHKTFSENDPLALTIEQKIFCITHHQPKTGPYELFQKMQDDPTITFSSQQLDKINQDKMHKRVSNLVYGKKNKKLEAASDWKRKEMNDDQIVEVLESLKSTSVLVKRRDIASIPMSTLEEGNPFMSTPEYARMWRNVYVHSYERLRNGKWRVVALSNYVGDIITHASQMFASHDRPVYSLTTTLSRLILVSLATLAWRTTNTKTGSLV